MVIVYVGTTTNIEAEGRDRTKLGLPGNQQELVEAVLAANPKTIVVEMNAGPLAIPSIAEKAPAILEAWWAGEEGGNAIADVIFGNINPGGKMPLTVYASDEQVPPQDEYDISKGFTYMYLKGKPLFAFGHGLSYTTFKYDNLKIADKQISDKGTLTATFDVTNTGIRTGDEVAQLYFRAERPSVPRPVKELRAFQRITLRLARQKPWLLLCLPQNLHFTTRTRINSSSNRGLMKSWSVAPRTISGWRAKSGWSNRTAFCDRLPEASISVPENRLHQIAANFRAQAAAAQIAQSRSDHGARVLAPAPG